MSIVRKKVKQLGKHKKCSLLHEDVWAYCPLQHWPGTGLGGNLWPTECSSRAANILLLLLTTAMIVAIYWAPIICWPLGYGLYLNYFKFWPL